MQTSFVEHLGLSERVAFIEFQLAPLELRRDIGMLGALWKIAHGKAHKFLQEMFPMCSFAPVLPNTRGIARRHQLRFVDRCVGDRLFLFVFTQPQLWNTPIKRLLPNAEIDKHTNVSCGATQKGLETQQVLALCPLC